jgi:pyruvate kinase
LYRGVYPCLYPKARPSDPKVWQEDVDARLHWAMQYVLGKLFLQIRQASKLNLLAPGDVVIAIQGWRGGLGNSNTLRVFSL